MTPAELAAAIADLLRYAIADGEIDLDPATVPQTVHLERPRQREHGDWATNIAMQLGKKAGMAPRAFAEIIAARLEKTAGVKSVDVAGPGFLNIRLDASAAGELARSIVEAGPAYGRSDVNADHKINLEFVSANPTGPIHMGGTRWAAVGDSLARVLEATGADVTREYYFNDHGAQIDRFVSSVLARMRDQDVPEDGYGGAYIDEIAQQVLTNLGGAVQNNNEDELREAVRENAVGLMFEEIKQSLADFGVEFDVYFHEESLHADGAVERSIARLRELGHVYDQDGAVWLATTKFGDDKDRVIIKSDGDAAYMAGDIAYYLNKRERGFDRNLIMLGADHHGYVGRLMAMCAAFGDEPEVNLEVLIGQMVNLIKDGAALRMSKRAGTVVTLEDLVELVGVDAARYALARSSADTALDIDLDLFASATNENPVFYVQYAHARTVNVGRNAAQHGVARGDGFDPSLLDHETESVLLGALSEFPRIIAQAAELREPHRIARYLEALAGQYHRWYDACRVAPLGDAPVTDLHRSRLWLNDATRTVLANGLGLLGVSAPERM
ncbi:MAG TPA: arginine--tRNA ligase [Actinomycetales bacterium]|nr:arginine--tRNA ligase [Actinomycetales bacterium]